MNKNKIAKKDFISGIILIILSGCGVFQLKDIPFRAAIFPEVMLGGIITLAILLILKSLNFTKMHRQDEHGAIPETIDEKEKPSGDENSSLISASLLTMGLYILLMPILGFFLATIFFMFAILFVLKMRRYLLMAFLAVLTSAFVFVIFKTVMYISLPSGIFDPTEYLYRLISQ